MQKAHSHCLQQEATDVLPPEKEILRSSEKKMYHEKRLCRGQVQGKPSIMVFLQPSAGLESNYGTRDNTGERTQALGLGRLGPQLCFSWVSRY